MDNPTTLLVAIMYVTIISIGLSNLLMTLSNIAGGRQANPDKLHLSWLLLLLFAYFNFFWQTTIILEFENWQFSYFVGFLLGPICLLFGTNLLISMPDSSDSPAAEHYLEISSRAFLLIGLFFAWIIGLDYVSGDVTSATLNSAFVLALCITLMISQSYKVHKFGAVIGWLLLLFGLVLNAF